MTDEPITIQILKDIRDEARTTNKRLESVEGRLESMDGRLGSVEGHLVRLEGTTASRFESLERAVLAGFGVVKDQLDVIRVVAIERHLDLDARVRALEIKTTPPPRRRGR
jgi:hypothetical protein